MQTQAQMQSMVPELKLTGRQRVMVQLAFSFVMVLTVVALVKSVYPILDAIQPEVAMPREALPVWVVPVVILVSLVPAAFVFFLFKYHFDFMEAKQT